MYSSNPPKTNEALSSAWRIVIKALLLFAFVSILFFILNPSETLGKISLYNHIFPGRTRLPYGDNPQRAYNLSLFNLEAMFASHELAFGEKPDDEYRVILIGDLSTWGFLLPHEQALSSQINEAELVTRDGREIRVYNLGYPVMSLTKDLLMLSYAMRYEPDMVIWLVTLESFPKSKQLFPPLLQHNPQPVGDLITAYQLDLDPDDPAFVKPSLWDQTLFGQRRNLADLIRFQIYAILWSATGIDQDIPKTYTPRQEDLEDDNSFQGFLPGELTEGDLAFGMIEAAHLMAGDMPIILVNEPMFISEGENSDIRYNFFYPRWAYDQYRQMMNVKSAEEGWIYFDLWDAVDNEEFTNSAVHISAEGTAQLARRVAEVIEQVLSK